MVRESTPSNRSFASLLVALTLALWSYAAGAQQAWTCTGLGAAACAIQLSLQSPACPQDNQVCVGSADAFSSTGASNGCVCLPACARSADCGAGEACIGALGGHCTGRFAGNADRDCPNDATCTLGYCSKGASCSNNVDCPSGTPDCVRGACVALAPGQCSTDAQCNADPCVAPQRCDTSAGRCVVTGPRPCAGISGAQCVATGGSAQCLIPACTSNAQCQTDPCAGTPQRCNVATGRCEPGDKPCQDGSSFCVRVTHSPGLAYGAPARPDPLGGVRPPVDRIDPGDLPIDWHIDPPGRGPGGRQYTWRMWLPAGMLANGARPTNLRLTVAGADCGKPSAPDFASENFCERPLAWNAKTRKFALGPVGGPSAANAAPAQPVDPCGGSPRCFAAGTFVVEIVGVTPSAMTPGARHHTVALDVRFRNVSDQPVILGYRKSSSSGMDNFGNGFAWGRPGTHDTSARGIGYVDGRSADLQCSLAPGQARSASFGLIRFNAVPPVGTAFGWNVVSDELELLPGQQIRSVRQNSVSLRNLAPGT